MFEMFSWIKGPDTVVEPGGLDDNQALLKVTI